MSHLSVVGADITDTDLRITESDENGACTLMYINEAPLTTPPTFLIVFPHLAKAQWPGRHRRRHLD